MTDICVDEGCVSMTGKNEKKRVVAIIVVLVASLTLTACEASEINKAKDIVDEMVVCDIKLIDAEINLETAQTARLVALYQKEIEIYEKQIGYYRDDLDEICAELSEKGKNEVQEYIDQAYREAMEQYNNS